MTNQPASGPMHLGAASLLLAVLLAWIVLTPVADATHIQGCGKGDLMQVAATCVYECIVVGALTINVLAFCSINNTRCTAARQNLGVPDQVVVPFTPVVMKFCRRSDSPAVECAPPGAFLVLNVCNLV